MYFRRNEDGELYTGYKRVGDREATDQEVTDYFAAKVPVPATITRSQCALAMYKRGMITGPQAIAMVKSGDLPPMVSGLLSGMTQEQRIDVEINFARDTYARDYPLLIQLMKATGASDTDIDNFFRYAASL